MTRSARGFSIIETVLAIVVGALVMLGCVSVFLATSRAERAFGQRYQRTSELWTTQLAVAREALAKSGLKAKDIAGIGITNQRETTVIWDRKTG